MLDPLYFIIVGPFMLLAMYAQWKVSSSFRRGAQVAARSGMTGAQVARSMLDDNDMRHIAIEPSHGTLSDHYDPRAKVVRLSPEVYGGNSLASLAVAAHEVGHAIQDRTRYPLLAMRGAIVPLANFGSQFSMIIFIVGIALATGGNLIGKWLLAAGVALFAMTVVFQLVNLPVEFDASKRAKAILVADRYIAEDELPTVSKVLSAAAMTYVAATLSAVATLLYFIIRAQGASRNN